MNMKQRAGAYCFYCRHGTQVCVFCKVDSEYLDERGVSAPGNSVAVTGAPELIKRLAPSNWTLCASLHTFLSMVQTSGLRKLKVAFTERAERENSKKQSQSVPRSSLCHKRWSKAGAGCPWGPVAAALQVDSCRLWSHPCESRPTTCLHATKA